MRFRPASSSLGRAGAAAAALLLWACFGGTGTDTENGIVETKAPNLSMAAHVTDGDGHPLKDVILVLRYPGFRPDSGGPAGPDSLGELKTDAAGDVKFQLRASGKFVVEGGLGGAVLFYDTVAVADSTGRTTYTFRSRPGRNFKGTVRLASGLRIDSGVIFVRGTGKAARLAADGTYDLGSLPAEVAVMSVGLRYSAVPVEFRVAEQKPDTNGMSHPISLDTPFACREISADSARAADRAAMAAPESSASPTPTVDSSRVKAAAKSCDSLQAGTVVTVRAPPGSKDSLPATGTPADTVAVNYVAVNSADAAFTGGTRLVPLASCVPAPGTETTTFGVQLQPTATGSDAVVGDVSASCK
jgi:hypothetical protein